MTRLPLTPDVVSISEDIGLRQIVFIDSEKRRTVSIG